MIHQSNPAPNNQGTPEPSDTQGKSEHQGISESQGASKTPENQGTPSGQRIAKKPGAFTDPTVGRWQHREKPAAPADPTAAAAPPCPTATPHSSATPRPTTAPTTPRPATGLTPTPSTHPTPPLPRAICDVCPRHCRLAPGQRGACFVRSCHDDGLIHCDTYGVSSGFAIDPIEKKPLNHFLPGSTALSFGTAGCNSACRFCQNWELSAARSWARLGSHASPADIASAAASRGARSVAFTYNDPIVFAEYAIDTADACRERGVHPVAVTAGYMAERAATDFYAHMDAANIDLKGFDEGFYRRVTGTRLGDVLHTIEIACATRGCWVELTTLLIPGFNDDDAQLHAECAWIRDHVGRDVPLHFSAFHPDFRMMDVPSTPPDTLTRARRIAISEGLRFVYTGNVRDAEGSTTFCPACGEALVVRDWFRVTLDRLSGGEIHGILHDSTAVQYARCPSCGEAIPGVWR